MWTGSAALQALRRKKRLERQLAQTDGTLSTLEFQREAIENATTNAEVLRTMEIAAQGMKKAYQDMWVWGGGQEGAQALVAWYCTLNFKTSPNVGVPVVQWKQIH